MESLPRALEEVQNTWLNKDNIYFIRKYGIDNIIALDKETNGIFSHKISNNKRYIKRTLKL